MMVTEQPYTSPSSANQQSDILVAASAVLANSSVGDLRFLRVDEQADTLRLSGQVRSYYHKQLAQETVRVVAGNMQVVIGVSVRDAN